MKRRTYTINAAEAGSKFADLLQKVSDGGKVIITKGGESVAQISAVRKVRPSLENAVNLGTPLPKKLTSTIGGPDDGDPFERTVR